jgi:hypothetical protein
MFLRWKRKYAYLERRYLTDGKVKSKSTYLGQNPLKALAKMLAEGEISNLEYRKIRDQHFEGTLKPTGDGGFGISEGPCGLLKNTRVSIYFDGRWQACRIAKDESGCYLVDDKGYILGIRPGVKVRLFV